MTQNKMQRIETSARRTGVLEHARADFTALRLSTGSYHIAFLARRNGSSPVQRHFEESRKERSLGRDGEKWLRRRSSLAPSRTVSLKADWATRQPEKNRRA
jgi:hypothetical protein